MTLPKFTLLVVFVLVTSFSASLAVTPEPPAVPSNYVIDLAQILPPSSEDALNRYLRNLEQKTSVQIMLLTILSLDGQDIEGFSMQMAERWRPGQKGKDNGMLIVIALNDRKYRIEVGYGLEGIIPDSLAGSLARQHLVPHFKKADYSTGISALIHALGSEIALKSGVSIDETKPSKPAKHAPSKELSTFELIGAIAVALVMLYLLIRHPDIFLLIIMSSGRGGWSGGSSSGGGFGGGGGSFGGGGVSGRW